MKKMLFVYNPHSGKGLIKHHLAEIIDTFTAMGCDVLAHPTQAKLDANSVVMREAPNSDIVVCSGGDGTLNETIRGILSIPEENRPLMGYIPAGTVNDFASSLRIPKYMPAAVKCIVNGEPKQLDIGGFNDRYFTYIAAFGAFTDVAYMTSQQLKNIFGTLAYIMEGVKRLGEIKGYKMKITTDDMEIEDTFIFGMISNSKSVGGLKRLSVDDVLMDDGIYEGFLIRMPQTLIELQHTINYLIRRELSAPCFYCFKTKNARFISEEAVPWTLDGEFGGDHTDVSVTVNHRAIKMLLDPNRGTELLSDSGEMYITDDVFEYSGDDYDETES